MGMWEVLALMLGAVIAWFCAVLTGLRGRVFDHGFMAGLRWRRARRPRKCVQCAGTGLDEHAWPWHNGRCQWCSGRGVR